MVDSVNLGAEPDPAKEQAQKDHDAAMVAKAEEGVTSIRSVDRSKEENFELQQQADENDGKPQRPEDIPEKFWDAEKGEVNVAALLKAQQDAEAALRKTQQGKQEETPEGTPQVEAGQQSVVDAASAEWAEKGELSEETFSSLEKVGLSRDMVNAYIDGQKAIVSSIQQAAFSEFDGTQESYQQAIEWAAESLSDEEIQALDLQLTSTNPAIVKQGAKALAAKYKADADITPDVDIHGDGNSNTTGAYFKSQHEMLTAMRDKRYEKDDAFRSEVARKIDRATKLGVRLYG